MFFIAVGIKPNSESFTNIAADEKGLLIAREDCATSTCLEYSRPGISDEEAAPDCNHSGGQTMQLRRHTGILPR